LAIVPKETHLQPLFLSLLGDELDRVSVTDILEGHSSSTVKHLVLALGIAAPNPVTGFQELEPLVADGHRTTAQSDRLDVGHIPGPGDATIGHVDGQLVVHIPPTVRPHEEPLGGLIEELDKGRAARRDAQSGYINL